jgi:hypothetical protein
VADQYFFKGKGTLYFRLVIAIGRLHSEPNRPGKLDFLELEWPITDETIWGAMFDFYRLGYQGNTITGLDPCNDGFHNFRGAHVYLVCTLVEVPTGYLQVWELGHTDRWIDRYFFRPFDDLLLEFAEGIRFGNSLESTLQGVKPDDDPPF